MGVAVAPGSTVIAEHPPRCRYMLLADKNLNCGLGGSSRALWSQETRPPRRELNAKPPAVENSTRSQTQWVIRGGNYLKP